MECECFACGVGGASEDSLGLDCVVLVEAQLGKNGARSKPVVKAVSEVELRTTARISGSELAWWMMWPSCVHMLCGVSEAGEGGGGGHAHR